MEGPVEQFWNSRHAASSATKRALPCLLLTATECLRVGARLRECRLKNGTRPDAVYCSHSRGYGLPGRIYAAWPREEETEEDPPLSSGVDSRLPLMHNQSPCWSYACRRGKGGFGSMSRGWSRSSRTSKDAHAQRETKCSSLAAPVPLVCYV